MEEIQPSSDPSLDPLPLLKLEEKASGSGSSTAKKAKRRPTV
jgi:hypothetical protein